MFDSHAHYEDGLQTYEEALEPEHSGTLIACCTKAGVEGFAKFVFGKMIIEEMRSHTFKGCACMVQLKYFDTSSLLNLSQPIHC